MNQFNNIIWTFNPFTNLGEKASVFFTELLQSTMAISTDVCIIAGLIGAILFIFGWKKCKNVPFITFAIHLIIQIVGGVILG